MTHEDIIRLSDEVPADSEQLGFIKSFRSNADRELVAFLCAWASNDGTGDIYAVRKLVEETMGNEPHGYIVAYKEDTESKAYPDASFHRTLTYGNLAALMARLHDIIVKCGCIRRAVMESAMRKKNRCTYAHEALCMDFSGGTGLPSRVTNGSFYRYYLFIYWMVYKLGIWESAPCQVLLPCDDQTFIRAYDLGLTKKYDASTLRNAVMLTKKACKIFGDDKFYKLYEVLNLHKDAEVKRIY